MANPMEPKLIGLLAGLPWHLRGSGPDVAASGAAAAALSGEVSGIPIRSPPSRRSGTTPSAPTLRASG
eukprot:15466939-Alexandrium_andersonii.AAC.1